MPLPPSPSDSLMSPTSETFVPSPAQQSLSDAVFSRLSWLAGFRASRTAWPASEAPAPTSGISGPSAGECFATYDPASRSSRTSPACSLLTGDFFSTAFCRTWPRFGTLVNGKLYQQPMLARPIDGTGSGSSVSMNWPTAIANDAEKRGVPKVGAGLAGAVHEPRNWPTARAEDGESAGRRHSRNVSDTLTAAVRDWPTATSRDYKGARSAEAIEATGRNPMTNTLEDAIQAVERAGPPPTATGLPDPVSGSTGGSRQGLWLTPRANEPEETAEAFSGRMGDRGLDCFGSLSSQAKEGTSAKLNPSWVETLMGFPIGHTQLPHKFVKLKKAK